MNEVEILKKLISFQTNTSFYNNKIKKFILDLLKNKIKKTTNIANTQDRCFFIEIKKNNDLKKKPIVFLCHLDTIIPTGNWISNPYVPKIEDDRIIGLGASDMKGSVATIIKALISTKCINRNVYLFFTSDEETEVKDIKKIIQKIEIENAIIIAPEPTNGNIRIGQKGILEVRITTKGKNFHASKATVTLNQESNAIYKMGTIIDFIKKQELTFNKEKDSFSETSTVSFGKISGGSIVNSTADSCLLEVSYRLNINDLPEKTLGELRKKIDKIDKKTKLEILLSENSFLNTNEKDLMFLKNITNKYFKNSEVTFGKAWSEIVYLNKRKNSCFILGPGEMNQAHSQNEYIKIDNLNKFCKIYSNILENS